MRDWSAEFNALPEDVREIACAVSCKDQINNLLREKARLKKRYQQSVREINDHIKNHEKWLRDNFS